MADWIDEAGEVNEVLKDAALKSAGFDFSKNQSPALAPEDHPDFDGTHCVDCHVVIPEQRLFMGRVRCVDCQAILEYRRKTTGQR